MEGVATMKKHSKNNRQQYTISFRKYLRKQKLNKIIIFSLQIGILVLFFGVWELLAKFGAIDTFIMSSPSRILKTIGDLFVTGDLMHHIGITLYEALLGFAIATIGGSLIAILLWWNETIRRVLDPYIVVLNSLPKIALGPIIIIWMGAGTKAIVTMDILIMIIITVISMMNSFNNCDKNKILLLQSMGAKKYQILFKLILPNALCDFISVLKINVGLTWVGTIMGEYLVSSAGLGYLIVYGGQVFKLDLVMSCTVILCILAAVMYFIVAAIEKYVKKKRNLND